MLSTLDNCIAGVPNLLYDLLGQYGEHRRVTMRSTLVVYSNVDLMSLPNLNLTFSDNTGPITSGRAHRTAPCNSWFCTSSIAELRNAIWSPSVRYIQIWHLHFLFLISIFFAIPKLISKFINYLMFWIIFISNF